MELLVDGVLSQWDGMYHGPMYRREFFELIYDHYCDRFEPWAHDCGPSHQSKAMTWIWSVVNIEDLDSCVAPPRVQRSAIPSGQVSTSDEAIHR